MGSERGTSDSVALGLEAEGLEVAYGPRLVLRGVSLAAKRGEVTAVIGANGAGKTTLLRALSGMLRLRTGTVRWRGRCIDALSPAERVRHGVVHVPEGREVFPFRSVEENLVLGGWHRSADERRSSMRSLYERFPVLHRRRRVEARLLSGGEQQMLALARALMAEPELLLLDEPSLGLAPVAVRELYAHLRELLAEGGRTVLLVEQNARLALETASRGVVFENGRVVLEGSAEELLRHPSVKEYYLGAKSAEALTQRRWKQRRRWS